MAFTALRFYQFRNLCDATVPVDAREVFLVGENGQGKTNFLEAVYVVCYGSSFRTRRDDLLRRTGCAEAAVEGWFADPDPAAAGRSPVGRSTSDRPDTDRHSLPDRHATTDRHTVRVVFSGRAKQIEFDGKPIADRKSIIANIPCIVFCHDDIVFVSGAPDMQRWFMNQTQSLLEPLFVDELRRYNRVLKMRNAALRDRREDLLDVLDLQLVDTGLPVRERRADLCSRFSRTLESLFASVFETDVALELDYRPSWADADPASALEAVREARKVDLDLKTTTRGPHRDRFPFRFGGRLLTDVASTGQLRLVSLILRVVQAELISRSTGRKPVLLLDDVLLELDPRRRARFVDALPEYEQAFFTFLPDEQYARFRRESTVTYRVCGGAFEKG